MRNYLAKVLLISLGILMLYAPRARAQLNVQNAEKTFTSANAKVTTEISPLDMVQIHYKEAFKLGATNEHGIIATIEAGGKVEVAVYDYDPDKESGRGTRLYYVYSDESSTTYVKKTERVTYEIVRASFSVPIASRTTDSDDIRKLAQGAKVYVDGGCVDGSHHTGAAVLAWVWSGFKSSVFNTVYCDSYRENQPVIVEVKVKNATLNKFKIPGIGEIDAADFFGVSNGRKMQVWVNGEKRIDEVIGAGNINTSTLNLTMGDKIEFKMIDDKHFQTDYHFPKIEGVPGTWIARFAGDLMYYCSPSVTPGEYNPFIGYDSRVHNLQLRKYPENFEKKVPEWAQPAVDTRTWSWTVQRRMDAGKTKYAHVKDWIKHKTLNDGSLQRNNQKEGLNIQFLSYWNDFLINGFHSYDGQAKYMMGFDDDELLMLGTKHHDIAQHPIQGDGGVAKLDKIPSRSMPEGDKVIYDSDGYPKSGNPLNLIISAYQQNRKIHDQEIPQSNVYKGYEIQDKGTNETYPNGTGTGNNVAPGHFKVKYGGIVINIPVNVKAPLSEDKGFYGSITGEQWPAYGEPNVPYTLSGLKNLSNAELDKFSLEYSLPDALGNVGVVTKHLKDLSAGEKDAIRSSGRWTAPFDMKFGSYAAITAYYQRTPTSKRVMIAGKELKPIFLLFLGETDLEGKGLGAKIWLEDFRKNSYGEYTLSRGFAGKDKYTKPYVRKYTFPKGHTTTFTAWDGDPHLFYDPGTEWFLSSRTWAKRVPDDYLDGTNPNASKPYLKYFINGVEQTAGRSGKLFTHTWNTPGEYELKVQYRTAGRLTEYSHKIKIVEYDTQYKGQTQKGQIALRDLTTKEKQFLNVSGDHWKIAEVADVMSQYKYKDGPRANNPQTNRWAEHNDFDARYKWRVGSEAQALGAPTEMTHYVNNYSNSSWFWNNWALHYSSSWRDHYPNGLPSYIPNSAVTRVIDLELDRFSAPLKRDLFTPTPEAPWQNAIPLVSYTDHQGYRLRTNPSSIYDIHTLWDNDHGAFSGNPKHPDPSKIQAPDISDDDKDRQQLYYDLKGGTKMLINTNVHSSGDLYVFSLDASKPGGEVFVGQTTLKSRSRRSLAFEKETSQSSYYSELEGHSSLAVDGNIGGVFSDGSVTHTASESQPWWEVDLEEITRIDTVLLHNRTDCCSERLGNYHVLISNQPFGQASLEELKTRPGVHEYHQPAISGTLETFVPEVWGRYVRVQLAGTEALSLAEVEVHGSPLPEPLGHWKLDDEVLNSGSTSAALPSGAIPQGGVFFDGINYREGWGSLSFDGSGYAELSPLNGDSFLHDGFADRSVSLWVRVEEATTQTIYDEGGTSNGLAIRYHANGTIEVATRNNGTQFTLPGYPIERGLWYHVAATYGAGGRLRLYIDGHQVSEGFAPYTIVNTSSDNAAIGATVSEDAFGNVGTGQYLTGQIDDVRVFDSELGIGDLGWYRYPKASFKSLGSYSPGELITFTDASTNNPTSWQWTFEGGSPSVSTEQNPVVSFGAPGSYAVTLQVGNAQGISEPVRGHVNVTDLGSDHYYRLVNTATGKALEVEGWSRNDGGNIRQWDYVGGTNQLFVLEKDLNSPAGGVTIRPAHALPLGKVLEAGVGGPGTGAITWHDNFTNHQRWHIVPRGLGLGNDFYIINDHTNLVLSVQDGSTANGAEVIVSNLDAYNDAHHWRFEPVAPLDANVQPLVTYELEAAHSGLLFDLYHGATADGTPIHQWPRNGTNAQKWYFQQLNRIEWELYSVHTNKLVEKGGGDESGAGASVNQWTPLDVQRQRWIMMELGNELYGLVNAQRPDLCAVVQNGSLVEGSNIVLQPCRLEDATHQWRLKPEAGVVYSVARQQSEEEGNIPAELETAYEGLHIYPNPTTDAVTVQFGMEVSGTVQISITDLLGRSVYSKTIEGHVGNQEVTLDDLKTKGIQSGVFLLRVSHGNHIMESRLIVQ